MIKILRNLPEIRHDQHPIPRDDFRIAYRSISDDVSEPETGDIGFGGKFGVYEGEFRAGDLKFGRENYDAAEETGCELGVSEDGDLRAVHEEDGRVFAVAVDVGGVDFAYGVEDGASDARGVGDAVVDVDVAGWGITREGGAADPAGVVVYVVAVDGAVAARVETVGYGA